MDILGSIGLVITIISTSIAIYEFAVIRESRKRRNELQYLLASINNAALYKSIAWSNQLSLLKNPQTEEELIAYRAHIRAQDDFKELAILAAALEGTIDINTSAITQMSEESIKQAELSNRLQDVHNQK